MANWEAFIQNVAGGIQRGASGWAGTIRSDIERKKTQADRLEIQRQEQDYLDKRQRVDHEWEMTRTLVASGLAKKNAEFESQLRQQEAKDMAAYSAQMKRLRGDPNQLQLWASMEINGMGHIAKAQSDLLDRLDSGEMPGPKDKELMSTFSPILRNALGQTLQANADRMLERKGREAYAGYFNAYRAQLQDKEIWNDIAKVSEMYEDATVKLGGIQKNIDDIMGDVGFQAVSQEASKYKTPEELMQKNPAVYSRMMSYQQRIGIWKELMGVQYGIQQSIKSRLDGLAKAGPKPMEPTEEDKKALAAQQAAIANPKMSKPKPARRETFWESAQPAHAGEIVSRKLTDLGTQLLHGALRAGGFESVPTAEEIVTDFNLKPDDLNNIYITKTPEDARKIASGEIPLAEGTLIYDSLEGDLMRAFVGANGELRLLEVRKKKKAR